MGDLFLNGIQLLDVADKSCMASRKALANRYAKSTSLAVWAPGVVSTDAVSDTSHGGMLPKASGIGAENTISLASFVLPRVTAKHLSMLKECTTV